jgi:hypothetical protein
VIEYGLRAKVYSRAARKATAILRLPPSTLRQISETGDDMSWLGAAPSSTLISTGR